MARRSLFNLRPAVSAQSFEVALRQVKRQGLGVWLRIRERLSPARRQAV